jgi:hypothetical protein
MAPAHRSTPYSDRQAELFAAVTGRDYAITLAISLQMLMIYGF